MSLAARIAAYFVQQGVVSAEDEPLYRFGLEQLFFQLLNFIVAVAIGASMGQLVESMLFLTVYIPLRKYAGGWHASTQMRCFWLSTAVVALALLIIRAVPLTGLALTLLVVPGAVAIIMLAPVADANKPLSKNEHKIYGRRARMLLAAILAIIAGLAFLNLRYSIACIGTAIFTLSVMLVLGSIKNGGKKVTEQRPEANG